MLSLMFMLLLIFIMMMLLIFRMLLLLLFTKFEHQYKVDMERKRYTLIHTYVHTYMYKHVQHWDIADQRD